MKQLLTYDDVAKVCRMSKSWVMKQRRLGKLKATYFGPMVRFREEDVERFLELHGVDGRQDEAKILGTPRFPGVA